MESSCVSFVLSRFYYAQLFFVPPFVPGYLFMVQNQTQQLRHLQGLPHLDFAGHPQSYKWYLFAWELEMSRVSTTAEHDINLIVLGGHPLLLDSGEREEEEEEGVHVWVVALKVFNIYVNNSKQKL